MKTLPVAVQVYSVREDAEKDFAGTMKKIKEIGYDGVELAGLYGLEPAAIKAAIEDAGLVALSAHVPFQELVADMEGTIQKYVEIGMKYIAIPYLMEEDRPGTPKFEGNVKLFEEIAKACKAKGIQLLYHNHDFEFQKMADGRYALDYIYDTIPADLLQTEVDTCWVKVAGEDPAAYVKKYTGRSPLVHLKDFHKEGRPANMYSSSAPRWRSRRATAPSSSAPWATATRTSAPFWRPLWKPAPSGLWWSRTSPTAAPPWKPSPSAAST